MYKLRARYINRPAILFYFLLLCFFFCCLNSIDMSKTKYSKVVIIGAGFSGLTMACQLQDKFGELDYTIYERAKEVGGTWSANKCTFFPRWLQQL